MSLKRPLSPESNKNFINNTVHQSKRLKLHSIIQKLQNEEACLVLLKKLHSSQQLLTQKPNHAKTITNGSHTTQKPDVTQSIKQAQLPTTNVIQQPQQQQQQQEQQKQQSLSVVARKSTSSPLLANTTKVSKNSSFEEYKTQAKLALRKQLEHNLLNISLPKPSLQDIVFIPNGASLEFQFVLGLEDAVQCLNELQNGRQRLPQRFTDQANTEEPYICDQCGTDFTVRWWKHVNSKLSNNVMSILCDRCKKQVTRRTSKSEHSASLKKAFLSAMQQEKEIDKHFNALIKHHKTSSRSSSSKPIEAAISPQIQSKSNTPVSLPSNSHQHQAIKAKNVSSTNLAVKVPLKFTPTVNVMGKSHVNSQLGVNYPTIKHTVNSRTVQHHKTHLPVHYQEQNYRFPTTVSQSMKTNHSVKTAKNIMKKQTVIPPSCSILPPNSDLLHAFLSSNLLKPTTTKRSTFPKFEKK